MNSKNEIKTHNWPLVLHSEFFLLNMEPTDLYPWSKHSLIESLDRAWHRFRDSNSAHRGCKKCVEVVNPGQTKVSQLQSSIIGEKNILRLDVSVNYSVTVEKVDSTQQLPHQILDLLLVNPWWRTLRHISIEILIHVLEHQVKNHLSLISWTMADVLQFDNVGMIVFTEMSQQWNFSQDCHGDTIVSHGDSHFLHGDYSIVLQVLCFVNCAIGSWKYFNEMLVKNI